MNRLTWRAEAQPEFISPGGFSWAAYLDDVYFGAVYNDGWSCLNADPIDHGSIHLAALRIQAAAGAL